MIALVTLSSLANWRTKNRAFDQGGKFGETVRGRRFYLETRRGGRAVGEVAVRLLVTVPLSSRAEEERMSETIDAARKQIAERLRELEAETRRLEHALKGMGERDRSRSAAPKLRRKRAAGKRRRRSKAPRGRRCEQLLAAIKAKPGARPSELAREIGISPNQVHGLIRKARAEKLIVKGRWLRAEGVGPGPHKGGLSGGGETSIGIGWARTAHAH
jgi:DNA-binding CsgD family transcriptional regulator